MDEAGYDISHLMALDTELPGRAVPTTTRSSSRSTPPAAAKPRQPTVAETQEALSRELMRTAEIHDALVRQYLRTKDNPFQDIGGVDDR